MTPAVTLSTIDSDDRDGHRDGDLADVAGVDGEAEGEEEHRGEGVAQGQHEPFDAVGDGALGEYESGHEGADGVGHAELLGRCRRRGPRSRRSTR